MRIVRIVGTAAGLLLACAAPPRTNSVAFVSDAPGPFLVAPCAGESGDSVAWAEDQLDAPLDILQRPGLGPQSPEGVAQLLFVVSADGTVELCTIEVLAASSSTFAEAARESLHRARYSAPIRGGQAVRARLQRRFSVESRIAPL